jgi:ribonuclease HI
VSGVLRVYTDGSCLRNPGPGGWGWCVLGGPRASGSVPNTTNQRMEITAALEAVHTFRLFEGTLEIVSDSRYVIDCFQKKWWRGWERNGWLTAQKRPVANRDLWQPLIACLAERVGPTSWEWIKAHAGHEGNELADSLANAAARAAGGARGRGR